MTKPRNAGRYVVEQPDMPLFVFGKRTWGVVPVTACKALRLSKRGDLFYRLILVPREEVEREAEVR